MSPLRHVSGRLVTGTALALVRPPKAGCLGVELRSVRRVAGADERQWEGLLTTHSGPGLPLTRPRDGMSVVVVIGEGCYAVGSFGRDGG